MRLSLRRQFRPTTSLDVFEERIQPILVQLDSLAAIKAIQGRLNLATKLLNLLLALLQQPKRLTDNLGFALVAASTNGLMNKLLEIRGDFDSHGKFPPLL